MLSNSIQLQHLHIIALIIDETISKRIIIIKLKKITSNQFRFLEKKKKMKKQRQHIFLKIKYKELPSTLIIRILSTTYFSKHSRVWTIQKNKKSQRGKISENQPTQVLVPNFYHAWKLKFNFWVKKKIWCQE